LFETNAQYLPAFKVRGGLRINGGAFEEFSYFLINGWRLQPQSGAYHLVINGNLFTEENTTPVLPALTQKGVANSLIVELKLTRDNVDPNILKILEQTTPQEPTVPVDPVDPNAPVALPTEFLQNIDSMKLMLEELWKIHGLSSAPVSISKTMRSTTGITQLFAKEGETLEVTRW
jgi:hypothetical protein